MTHKTHHAYGAAVSTKNVSSQKQGASGSRLMAMKEAQMALSSADSQDLQAKQQRETY